MGMTNAIAWMRRRSEGGRPAAMQACYASAAALTIPPRHLRVNIQVHVKAVRPGRASAALPQTVPARLRLHTALDAAACRARNAAGSARAAEARNDDVATLVSRLQR
jgi:hypothetical protein